MKAQRVREALYPRQDSGDFFFFRGGCLSFLKLSSLSPRRVVHNHYPRTVGALMWLRTTVNFQYKYGMGTTEALRHIYNDGGRGLSGLLRFYRGLGPALIQGPLSRFGDTAANEGAMAVMDSHPAFEGMPIALKSVGASAAAAAFRILLMPVDTLKTTLQVEGKNGMSLLGQKLRTSGPQVLWHGSLGVVSATFVGHYPWFFTRNQLQAVLPKYDRNTDTLNYLVSGGAVCVCVLIVWMFSALLCWRWPSLTVIISNWAREWRASSVSAHRLFRTHAPTRSECSRRPSRRQRWLSRTAKLSTRSWPRTASRASFSAASKQKSSPTVSRVCSSTCSGERSRMPWRRTTRRSSEFEFLALAWDQCGLLPWATPT